LPDSFPGDGDDGVALGEPVVEFALDRESARMSSRLTLLSLRLTGDSSSRCSVNFETVMIMYCWCGYESFSSKGEGRRPEAVGLYMDLPKAVAWAPFP
jgi:hypothetical protein